ncbi:hypothetical protein [Haloglomus litoreum]|uniref:hypothetical protein n=1 Tax=Haloglomus litoreum TaxID=3034026 RepID=UPI0023E7D978|nr:hypothetical protein [Haloglomus sp. DT116]
MTAGRDADTDGGPADASGDTSVCVVATRPDTFEACRVGLYPAPRSYDRTRREFDAMAFYRTAPVSAITHYARVTGRTEETRAAAHGGGATHMTPERWETLIAPFSEERTVLVFELDDLVPLSDPVANDGTGVRGAWYCTLRDLRAASALSDLRERTASG